MAPGKTLEEYLHRFSRLNRSPNARLGHAPHKPVLLLTLLDAVAQGLISENFVPVTPELAALCRQHWQALVPPGTWHEKMNLPFRHLLHDGFWELVKDGWGSACSSVSRRRVARLRKRQRGAAARSG